MTTMEAVKEIMKRKGVRPSDLYEALGVKSNVLSERFKQKKDYCVFGTYQTAESHGGSEHT